MVPQVGGWRELLVPKVEPNFYPAIMQKEEYDRLKKQAKVRACWHSKAIAPKT